MFNLFKKKMPKDKEICIFGDRASQYGFFILYTSYHDEIFLSECTLFDRDTYEEYTASLEIPCEDFLALLKKAKKENDNANGNGVTITCKDNIVKEISFYGKGGSGSARGSGIVNLSIDELIKRIKAARK